MTWKKFRYQLKYYGQYFPFTLNSFIVAALCWVAYKLLYQPVPKDESPGAFRPFVLLMGKMAFWFLITLVLLSILSTIAAWIYYLFLKRKKQTTLQLAFAATGQDEGRKKYFMTASLDGVRRPLLGFVKGRLFYDDHQVTDKFSLLSDKRDAKRWLRTGITGKSRLELPDVKEYELRGGFVFFEDMLHLFSLTASQHITGQFHQPPALQQQEDTEVYPRKTEQMDVRIEQMRRVEGEYLNYKDFEAGDDVRRIVWKVYAKNKDLVVRVPEMFEPYASHLYFYASFFADMKNNWLGEGYVKEMLNYYKNHVWTVFDTLAKKEWEMRYIPDQSFNIPEHLSLAERAERTISNAYWHKDKMLSDYFRPKQGAVLCISSFANTEELERVLEQCDAATVIYFVKCTRVFRHFAAWGLLKRIIFLPPRDRLHQLRSRWLFSPMRWQVQKKEKEIEERLEQSNVRYAIL